MSESSKRTGCLGRLLKLTVVFAGLGAIIGVVLNIATNRALQGSWQYVHADWSEATVTRILEAMGTNDSDDSDTEGATPSHEFAEAATKVGNALISAFTSHIGLEVTGGGYRIEGSTPGARLGTSILRTVGRGPNRLGGCTSGSFVAIFPLVHATCGDGSGRTLWFLMQSWPDEDLELFLLPLGNRTLRERVEKVAGRGSPREAAQTAKELLTLRFKRP